MDGREARSPGVSFQRSVKQRTHGTGRGALGDGAGGETADVDWSRESRFGSRHLAPPIGACGIIIHYYWRLAVVES